MTRDRRLGRGLAALLGNPNETEGGSPAGPSDAGSHVASAAGSTDGAELSDGLPHDISVSLIDPNPQQPRREFDSDELRVLAESIQTHRVLQPVLVRPVGKRFELISGERRWRAATAAGLERIPAIIREADDREAAEWAIVENLQRKDLSPVEKARSFKRYLENHGGTQEELAKRLQIDRSTVANLLRLLELPPSVHDLIQQGQLSAGHARALLSLGDEQQQEEVARQIVSESWSVRETERRVQARIRESQPDQLNQLEQRAKQLGRKTQSRHIAALERDLKMALGAKVEIRQSGRHSGRIVIHFSDAAEFERLQQMLLDGRIQQEAA